MRAIVCRELSGISGLELAQPDLGRSRRRLRLVNKRGGAAGPVDDQATRVAGARARAPSRPNLWTCPMTRRLLLLAAALMPYSSPAFAQDQADLAKAAQNPVAAMISLPFQNNTLFGVGPDDDVANVLNIQPVIPVTIGDWNLINRTIVPVIYLPDVTRGCRSCRRDERRQHLRARRHQPLGLLLAGGSRVW
jgi:hypothetical protein